MKIAKIVDFFLFVYSWDNGETEKLSPWDMEPIDESREYLVVSNHK